MGNDQDDMVIIPYTTAMERVDGIDYLRMLYVVAKDENGIDRLQSDIENLLRVRHGIKDTNLDDFNIQNYELYHGNNGRDNRHINLILRCCCSHFPRSRWYRDYEYYARIRYGTDS